MAALVKFCFIVTAFCILANQFVTSTDDNESVFSGIIRRKTTFRPLRRVVRNFVNTRTATITLVFQHANKVPDIRWFRQVEPNTLPNAEIPDMISIDLRSNALDQRYKLKTLRSYDVTSATLTIQPVDVASFPIKFVTLFTVANESFQYQLDTVIDEPTERNSIETLDGIIWQRSPHANISFSPELTVSCAVQLESESNRFTDELNIYRNYLDSERGRGGWTGGPQLMSAGCGKIHKDRDNYVEKSGKYTYEGRRVVTVPGSKQVLYEATFKIMNGTHVDVGAYTCGAERARDRTYISSWVHLVQPSRPVLIFLPCNDATASNAATQPYQVRVVARQPTCVRCRVYDYRFVLISLLKNGDSFRAVDSVLLDQHINVADGGLNELTINFLYPTQSTDAGLYTCSINVGGRTETVQFRLSVTSR